MNDALQTNDRSHASRVWALDVPLEQVTFDIYRDIHKGLRTALFSVTAAAGAMDPRDDGALSAFASRVASLVAMLESHAALEDRHLTPLLARSAADLARAITSDHVELDEQLAQLARAARALTLTCSSGRRLAVHRVYLGFASFTSDYLEHQAVEELEVMPALASSYTVEDLLRVNGEMLATISPEKMAATLALLLPAMNVDDRADMLNGIKSDAPREVFEGVRQIAASTLAPAEFTALASRIG